MKRIRFDHTIIILLILLSAGFFFLQQLLFHNIEESGFLIFQDMIFLPLHVVLITFFLDRVLNAREKRERLEQVNIVISAFFSETGIDTLKAFNSVVAETEAVSALLDMNPSWNDKSFDSAAQAVKGHTIHADFDAQKLVSFKDALPAKSAITAMFANPNLLEHDTFTDMLWALYHVTDELSNRQSLSELPKTDMDHISGDIVRAYRLLVLEWIYYMKHLKSRYPYLWSLAVRKSPFSKNASVIIY